MTPPRRRRRSRLALVLVLLVLLEGALQLAGPLVQGAMARHIGDPDPDAPLTVLCVGDSNTYGLNLPQVYAYPALLGNRLDSRYRRPVTVVNRGVPGQGTGQVARHLPSDLAHVEPDLVFLLAGINDAWNLGADGQGEDWLGRLRLVRLLRVLTAGVTTAETFEVSSDEAGQIVVDRGDGRERVNVTEGRLGTLQGPALHARVREGLGRCLESIADAGARPVLLTYAEFEGPFAGVNETIRELAAERDVLLVDVERRFRERAAAGTLTGLMFDDHHPTASGYELVAREAERVLEEAGLIPAVLPAGEQARFAGREPLRAPELERLGDGSLRVDGPRGWAWQLLIACRPTDAGQGFASGSLWVPLPADEVLATSRLEPGFSGRFDGEGPRILSVPRVLQQAAPCPLAACLLLLHEAEPGVTQAVAAVSPVVELPHDG